MTEAEKEAREEAERRWPDWVCPPVDEDPEPDYSEMDARWQNAESEMQRNAFVAGAAWQASRAPQPTEDERRIPGFAERERGAQAAWEFFARDDRDVSRDFRAGYHQGTIDEARRRAPAEPAVQGPKNSPQNSEPTDEAVEAFTVAINRAGYMLDRNATRVGLRAALSTESGDPRGPEPVRFDPPLTRAEADAFWNAITDQTESPDQDQPDRSE